MARLTAHVSKQDRQTYRYLRCKDCEPRCEPLGAVSLEEAEEVLARHMRERHGKEPSGRRTTADKALDAFLESRRAQHCSKGTVENYEGALRPFWKSMGDRPIRSWRRADAERWSAAHPDWADGTLRKFLRVSKTFIAWARDPAARLDVPDFIGGMKAPRYFPKPVEALSPEQVRRLLDGARLLTQYPWLEVAVNLAARCGLSAGDIRTLDWGDVRWNERRIVRPREKGGRPLDFAISDGLKEVLDRHRALGGPVCRDLPESDSAISKAVRELYAFAKVPRARGQGLHFLRTSFVSMAIAETADIPAVAEIVGDDPATVARFYTKSRDDRRAAAIRSVDKALAGA